MKISNLKAGLARREFRSSLGKNGNQDSSGQIMGVVLDTEAREIIQQFLELGRDLKMQQEHIHFLICSDSVEAGSYPRFFFSDVSWRGKIKKAEVNHFLEESFNLLVVFTRTTNPASEFIVGNTRAGLRIGRTEKAAPSFDLNISSQYEEVGVFIEELKKYINIIQDR